MDRRGGLPLDAARLSPRAALDRRENAFSREPARMVHALLGEAVIRVVGREGRHADVRVVSGRGRGRAGACPG